MEQDQDVRHKLAQKINKVDTNVKKLNTKVGNFVIILMVVGFVILLLLLSIILNII